MEPEYPNFDPNYGWYAITRFGVIFRLFKDSKMQIDVSLYAQAVEVVKRVIETGEPPFGQWA